MITLATGGTRRREIRLIPVGAGRGERGGGVELTDEQIGTMSIEQRRELIWRLARPSADLLPPIRILRRIRYVRLAIMTGSALLLIPWIAFLALTLPDRYVV